MFTKSKFNSNSQSVPMFIRAMAMDASLKVSFQGNQPGYAHSEHTIYMPSYFSFDPSQLHCDADKQNVAKAVDDLFCATGLHEIGHPLETHPDRQWRNPGDLGQFLWNSVEDIRVDSNRQRVLSGANRMFVAGYARLIQMGYWKKPTPDDPRHVFCTWVLTQGRAKLADQACFAEIGDFSESLVLQLFGQSFRDQAWQMLSRVTRARPGKDGTIDVFNIVTDLLALLQAAAQPSPQQSSSDDSDEESDDEAQASSDDSDGSDDDAGGSDDDAQASSDDSGGDSDEESDDGAQASSGGSDDDAGGSDDDAQASSDGSGSDSDEESDDGAQASSGGSDDDSASGSSSSEEGDSGSSAGDSGNDEAGSAGEEQSSSVGSPAASASDVAGSARSVLDGGDLPLDVGSALSDALDDASTEAQAMGATEVPIPQSEACKPSTVFYTGDRDTVPLGRRIRGLMMSRGNAPVDFDRVGSRIDPQMLMRVPFGERDVFSEERDVRMVNLAIRLVVDRSSSMTCGNRIGIARSAALRLSLAMASIENVSVSATAFPHQMGNSVEEVLELLPFGGDPRRYASNFLSLDAPMWAYTPMAQALVDADFALSRRRETRKICVVLTDGAPNYGTQQQCQAAISSMTRKGIEVVGIGIETMYSSDLFPRFELVHKVQDLETALFALFRSAALRKAA